MGIKVRAVGSSRGASIGSVAGFYDFSSTNENLDLRGGQGTRVRVGDVFEIAHMSHFSDSKKTRANGRRGWMELVDAPVTVAPPVAVVVPGQVPGQDPNTGKAVAEATPTEKAESATAPTGSKKVI